MIIGMDVGSATVKAVAVGPIQFPVDLSWAEPVFYVSCQTALFGPRDFAVSI
jgi:hypothetical protein